MVRAASKESALPTREELLDYILESPERVTKRDLIRAFRVSGEDRIEFKRLLRELADEGAISRGKGQSFTAPDALPSVCAVEIVGLDEDGEPIGRPLLGVDAAEPGGPAPRVRLLPRPRARAAPGVGDRVLARLRRHRGEYQGRVIRLLERGPERVVGVFVPGAEGGWVRPADRRQKQDVVIHPEGVEGAKAGDLVVAEVSAGRRRLGLPRGRVVERIGSAQDPRSFSLIALHSRGIPTEFPAEAAAEAEAAEAPTLDGREDLRGVPLVTIDGADARDFDDAVWAEPDRSPDNPGGWQVLVAITDVADYVRPGSALDREALRRGNSVYFPDRVVPMLPEALSNGLCSLRPAEERACLAVRMWFDAKGNKLRHRFIRGLMRSAARLTYGRVQSAADGAPDETTGPLLDPVIRPLYGAFRALLSARERRGTIDLDVPEMRVALREDGHVEDIRPRPRLDSHRLIEEFMIAANVAAAETLETAKAPCMYRVHDKPDPAKVEALRQFLAMLDSRMGRSALARPRDFSRVVEQAEGTPYAHLVNTWVLRTQAQAAYSPNNIGHFGLALRRYAHFTSPIRRYSDLLVHRSLIRALRLGAGALPPGAGEEFEQVGDHISKTERRAAEAERETIDRFTTAFLADRVGATFTGALAGVSRAGLFVRLDETGADGFIPVSTLGDDYFRHDREGHTLAGHQTGETFRLGDRVTVRLREADVVTGGLVFELLEHEPGVGVPAGKRKARAPRAAPGNERRRRRRG